MARFYNFSPFGLTLGQLLMLAEMIEPLRAEEVVLAASAARSAHLRQDDYAKFVRSFQRVYENMFARKQDPVRMAASAEEKAQAAAYFAAMGVKVVHDGA